MFDWNLNTPLKNKFLSNLVLMAKTDGEASLLQIWRIWASSYHANTSKWKVYIQQAVARRCPVKKAFLKISKYLCWSHFLTELQA